MILQWLPAVVDDGANVEGCSQILFAAHIAGRAFATGTGLGLAHGIANPLSARTRVVHGEAPAVSLPHVMTFSLAACTDVYGRLAVSLGLRKHMARPSDSAGGVIAAIQELSNRLGLDERLSPLGANPAMVPWIAW